jgi:hypothetical protein
MSDYLWDKTGEADEDVERLEEMLGQLRFQPRTFEVPATLPVVRRAPRTISHFSWSRLAVAASLILVALAGAWLVMTKQRANDAPTQFANAPAKDVTTPQPTQPKVAVATPTVDHSTTERKSNVKHDSNETATARNANRHLRRDELAGVVKRPASLPRHSIERDVTPRQESAMGTQPVTPQEREAMEKFMLAMKVTSEKLNYAERQVAELNTKSPQR